MEAWKGVFPLAVGSFPHSDPDRALDLIFECFPEIPLWPQLPNGRFLENMYVQYSAFMPAVRLDTERQRIWFETEGDLARDLETFYQHLLDEDLEYFRFPESHAAGFYRFLERFGSREGGASAVGVKGQVTGPFSFALSVPDSNRRSILYHADLFEAVVGALSMHARWQVERLKSCASRVILFVDEPYLVSFGSAMVSVDREVVIRSLNQVVDAVHQAGGAAGIHCCGNTDWSLVLETNLDILNFDAYQFFPNLILYAESLERFSRRGGTLAWGVVPSSEEVLQCSRESLLRKLLSFQEELASRLPEEAAVRTRAFVTPACGLGSQSEAVASDAVRKTRWIALNAGPGEVGF